jgi:hypothetical protein
MYLWTTVTFRGHLEDAARDIEAAGQELAKHLSRVGLSMTSQITSSLPRA